VSTAVLGPMSLYRQARQLALMETAVEMSEAEHLIDSPQHIAEFFFQAYEKHLLPFARVRSEKRRLDEAAVQQVAMKLALQLATVLRVRSGQFGDWTGSGEGSHMLDYVRLYPMRPGIDRIHLSGAYHALEQALSCQNERSMAGDTEGCTAMA
jgi:hypothetical protein